MRMGQGTPTTLAWRCKTGCIVFLSTAHLRPCVGTDGAHEGIPLPLGGRCHELLGAQEVPRIGGMALQGRHSSMGL